MAENSAEKKTKIDSVILKVTDPLSDFLLRDRPGLEFGRWLFIASLVFSLFVVFIVIYSLALSREYAVQNAQIHSRNLAQSINHNITATIQRIDHTLISMQHEIEKNLVAGNLNEAGMKKIIAFEESLLPEAVAIRVANADGRVIVGNETADPSASFADRPYFPYLRDHPDAGLYITKPIVGLFTKKWVITSAKRYNRPDGSFGGVVIAPVLLDHFQNALSGYDVGPGGALVLRHIDNGFVARYPAEMNGSVLTIGEATISRELQAVIDSHVLQKTFSAVTPFDRTMRTLTYQRIEAAPFYVIAGLAEDDYLAQWKRDRNITSAIVFIFLAGVWIVTGLLWFFWKSREQGANALREEKALTDKLINMMQDTFFLFDPALSLPVRWNKSFSEITGYSDKEITEMKAPESYYSEDDLRRAGAATGEILNEGFGIVEMDLITKQGTQVPFEYSGTSITTMDGRLLILSIGRNITARQQAEKDLRESEEKYRSLVETAQELVWKTDDHGCFTYLNPAWEEALGYRLEEMLGKSFGNIQPAEVFKRDMKEFARLMTGGLLKQHETIQIARDGSIHTLLINAIPLKNAQGIIIGAQGTAMDITERKQLEIERERFEHQRNQMQKLESLGVLAGGIAHDFNNLMAGIFSYIDLANVLSQDHTISGYLEKALNTIYRARGLTQQLLTFAKGGAPMQKIEQLFPFVEETAKFALSGSSVSSSFNVPDNLWPCSIDRSQIEQVIDNIIINAQQAMPDGGNIEVTARNISPGEIEHAALADRHYVRLSIKDSGIGIPKNILPRIFDPFYTTKTKGHGLGLATSYSIIKRHEGVIDVASEPGVGTTFHIYLPATPEAQIEQSAASSHHRGSGLILVMDDEEVIRETLEAMLVSLGYSVVTRSSGSEAVELFVQERNNNRPVASLILDLTVPGGMGGLEAVGEIRKLDSDVPVFVVSGYADDPVMENPAEYGFTASISKPFMRIELSEMLEKYLKKSK